MSRSKRPHNFVCPGSSGYFDRQGKATGDIIVFYTTIGIILTTTTVGY
jgi:hypothetical protein